MLGTAPSKESDPYSRKTPTSVFPAVRSVMLVPVVANFPVTGLSAGGNETISKGSISSALDSFWTVIQSLPIVELISGLSIVAGGSPRIEIQCVGLFGSDPMTVVFDMGNDTLIGMDYGTILGGLGNILLVIVSMGWVMWLFI